MAFYRCGSSGGSSDFKGCFAGFRAKSEQYAAYDNALILADFEHGEFIGYRATTSVTFDTTNYSVRCPYGGYFILTFHTDTDIYNVTTNSTPTYREHKNSGETLDLGYSNTTLAFK